MGSELSTFPHGGAVVLLWMTRGKSSHGRRGSLDSLEVDLPGLNAFVCFPFSFT